MSESPFLRVAVAARLVNLSVSNLNTLRIRGGGPQFLKVGGRVLYNRDELLKWMFSHTQATTSGARSGVTHTPEALEKMRAARARRAAEVK